MRHLASIRKISNITPIQGADSIVLAHIDGWQCVAKKEEFIEGDLCIYFEIDSHIPRMPQVEHLYSRSGKIFNGRDGIRIKTIRLRGELSQGLALPLSAFPDLRVDNRDLVIGDDVTDLLGIEKYEKPTPPTLAGQIEGNFPAFIPKTDQERCQNIPDQIFNFHSHERFEVTLKCDGSSFTGFKFNETVGVCSRNYQLKINENNRNNAFVRMFVDSGLQEFLKSLDKNIAIQAELMGPGIQKNRENLNTTRLFVFDIYDIDRQCYLKAHERLHTLSQLRAAGLPDIISHVPVLHVSSTLEELGITNLKDLLNFADRPSISNPIAEGVVFKSIDSDFTFKVISNKYLLKED